MQCQNYLQSVWSVIKAVLNEDNPTIIPIYFDIVFETNRRLFLISLLFDIVLLSLKFDRVDCIFEYLEFLINF